MLLGESLSWSFMGVKGLIREWKVNNGHFSFGWFLNILLAFAQLHYTL